MRKTLELTISEGTKETNRDHGKTFILTEMPALQASKWATKALLALAKSGADLSPDLMGAGMGGVAMLGIQAMMKGIDFAEAEPLIDELMTCVQIKEPAISRKLTSTDVEEIWTLFKLRGEVLKLHIGFFPAASR